MDPLKRCIFLLATPLVLPVLLAACNLAGSTGSAFADTAQLAQFIRQTEAEFPEALARKDSNWIKAHTAPGLVFMEPDGTPLSREAYADKRGHNPDSILSGENNIENMQFYNQAAVVYGNSHLQVMRNGRKYGLHFSWVGTYVKIDGGFKLASGVLVPQNKNWMDLFEEK